VKGQFRESDDRNSAANEGKNILDNSACVCTNNSRSVAHNRRGRLWSLADIMRRFSIAQLLRFSTVGGMARAKPMIDTLRLSLHAELTPEPLEPGPTLTSYMEALAILEKDCIDLDLISSLSTVRKM
jgi:hypothetical protein